MRKQGLLEKTNNLMIGASDAAVTDATSTYSTSTYSAGTYSAGTDAVGTDNTSANSNPTHADVYSKYRLLFNNILKKSLRKVNSVFVSEVGHPIMIFAPLSVHCLRS